MRCETNIVILFLFVSNPAENPVGGLFAGRVGILKGQCSVIQVGDGLLEYFFKKKFSLDEELVKKQP
jgi:hypothetical protein